MRAIGFWVAWIDLAIGTFLFLFTASVIRTTDFKGQPDGSPSARTIGWGPVACSLEAGPPQRWERASYLDWAQRAREYVDERRQPWQAFEYDRARLRLPRLETLNSAGWLSVVLAATGLVVSAWLGVRRSTHRAFVVVLATVLLAGMFYVVGSFIEFACFFPDRDDPIYSDQTLSWHPVALAWFGWTTLVALGAIVAWLRRRRTIATERS